MPNTPIMCFEGNLSSRIALVGEAPGETEEREGRPFVGSSGKLLMQCLASAGITRADCYITNVLKFRPPGNDITPHFSVHRNGVRTSAEYDRSVEYLREELSSCSANVIVPIGNAALYALCSRTGITNWRGSILESTLLPGRKCIPCLHPAAALRQYLFTYLIAYDMRRVMEQSSFPGVILTERSLRIYPSLEESIDYLLSCLHLPRVGFDIEVSGRYMTCFSLAKSGTDAICIPLRSNGKDYFNPEQEAQIVKHLALLLSNPDIEKIGQNLSFDATYMITDYHIPIVNIQDTMVAQGIIDPDFPKGLDLITSIYTDIPYYKLEGKKWFKNLPGGSEGKFFQYSALDSAVVMDAFPKQLERLQADGNLETYRNHVAIIPPLVYMSSRGIRMDTEQMLHASADSVKRQAELQKELKSLVGQHYTPKFAGSTKQLKSYFYVVKGYPPVTVQGKMKVDEKALRKLVVKGCREAALVLLLRKEVKMNSTYYKARLDTDGRLRCAYNPSGARSGRISSSETIFGTGTNLQNQPPKMKRMMLVDPGYIGFNVDLSQAENRVVAVLANEQRMMEAFARGEDVHRLTAGLIFNKPPSEVSSEKGSCSIGDGSGSERDWGKRANHSLNYDITARKFALYYEIPEHQAQRLITAYHSAYPGIRQWHASIVEELRANRTLTNLFGRKRQFLDRWGSDLFKAAYSWKPQSTVSDKLNFQGLNYLYYDPQFSCVDLLMQVHDSVGFQVPLALGFDKIAELLMALKLSLETPLTYHDRTFVIPADISVGYNFGKYNPETNAEGMRELKNVSTIEGLARQLHAIYG
jgi:uracil-DNA glycosylase family 4